MEVPTKRNLQIAVAGSRTFEMFEKINKTLRKEKNGSRKKVWQEKWNKKKIELKKEELILHDRLLD